MPPQNIKKEKLKGIRKHLTMRGYLDIYCIIIRLMKELIVLCK